jgi:hypothetical protein
MYVSMDPRELSRWVVAIVLLVRALDKFHRFSTVSTLYTVYCANLSDTVPIHYSRNRMMVIQGLEPRRYYTVQVS